MAGLLFLGGPGGGDVTLNGDGSSTFNGALYLPNRQLTLNGNVSAPNGGCSEMIADSITVNGSVRMQSRNCLGSGVKLAGGVSPSLVE